MFKLAILTLALTLASASHEANWLVYKQTHNKIYTEDEDAARRDIWETNLQQIEQHNELYAQGLSSFYLGENHFSDMTTEEFANLMNGVKLNKQLNPGKYQTGVHSKILPSHVDWRTKGYVTPVKDQGQCGSCWAFSTTGSVEGQHFKATKRLVSLSESNLMDCSGAFGTQGCNGGYMDDAFQYIINNTGIDTEASYPYRPENGRCRFDKRNIGATVRSFKDIESGNEDDLKRAVALVGPVSVAIDANHASFQFYKGGVYDEPDCSDSNLDHAVLVVGYGTQDDTDYWIVKNSWGITWGDHGYIKMSRNNNNQCGIATMASYPIV